MSEARRAVALQSAVQFHAEQAAEVAVVVKTAEAFEAFLSGGAAPQQPAETGGTKGGKGGKAAAANKEPAAGADADAEALKTKLAEKIGVLAKKDRPTCIKILAEFDAKSASSVPEKDRAACLKKIEAAIATAGEEDLTS